LWQNSFFEGKDRYLDTEMYDTKKEAAARAYGDQAILKETNPSPNSTFHHKTTNDIQIKKKNQNKNPKQLTQWLHESINV